MKYKKWYYMLPAIISLITLLVWFFKKIGMDITTFDTIIASFGLLFLYLKWCQDNANYQKSLFKERYSIFKQVDKLLSKCFQPDQIKDWPTVSAELDSFYRKAHFLFRPETDAFLVKFRQAVIDVSFAAAPDSSEELMKKGEVAKIFLGELLKGQNLSSYFPELKINNIKYHPKDSQGG